MRKNSSLNIYRGYEEAIKVLSDYGYTENEIFRMLVDLPAKENLANNIKEDNAYLESLGFTKTKVHSFVIGRYNFYTLTVNDIKEEIQDTMNLGVDYDTAIELTFNKGFFRSRANQIEYKNKLIKLGYTEEEVMYLIKTRPYFYAKVWDYENYIYYISSYLKDLGYTRKDLLQMTLNETITLDNLFDLYVTVDKEKLVNYVAESLFNGSDKESAITSTIKRLKEEETKKEENNAKFRLEHNFIKRR